MTQVELAERLVTDAAGALHRYGLPAHRLERTLLEMAASLGLELRVLATPTALTLAFGSFGEQRLVLMRVEPAGLDLGRLAALDAVVRELTHGTRDPATAREALRAVIEAPPLWSPVLQIGAGLLTSAGSAVLFRGSWADVVLAAVLGAAVAAAGVFTTHLSRLDRALPVFASFFAMAVARLASTVWPDVHALVVTLSAVIVMLPGLSFTLAMVELSSRHLASGTARLGAASVSLLQLGLGVALARAVTPTTPEVVGAVLPAWALALTLATMPPALGVLLGARPRDLGTITGASLAAYAGTTGGAQLLGADLGPGVGAFALALVANTWSRALDRPAVVPMTAGILMLVPGSFGVRSIALLLDGDVLLGVERAFAMVMVTTALAAGLVLASTLLPARRSI